ncbi:hypothetical protein HMPREF1982_03524 [Clostridiales bacterium oral taxon 876 str. F0540]|nr:hypothetical protein HMPREF1982_03524 [Clostridiales bacterium oral taxon 876 str. F0540]
MAEEFGERNTYSELPISKLYALLDVSQEEREEFISESHEINGQSKTVDEMTTRELQQAIKAKKEAESKSQQLEQEKLLLAEEKQKLEISENENRKDFSFSEKMQWAEQLKKEYEKIAKENQLSGLNNQTSCDKILPNDKIDSNKQVAEDVGLGNKETYRQAKYIYDNGSKELIKQLDDGQLSINKAYLTLKEEKQQLEISENENRKDFSML